MVDGIDGWIVGLFVDVLNDWLVGCLDGRLDGWLFGCLVVGLVARLHGRPVRCFVGWLVGY